MRKLLFLLLAFLSGVGNLFATHNRAGEITYTWIAGNEYAAQIVTYTNICNTQADRNFLVLYWGDGDSTMLTRSNGPDFNNPDGTGTPDGIPDGEILPASSCNSFPCTKKNIYTTIPGFPSNNHNYPGPGNYWLSMADPNRNAGILNIPNSVNVEFYIQSLLVISDILGPDDSPVLLNPPIDLGCAYNCFYHNPAAYSPDGDSLSYQLAPCLYNGNVIPGFVYPNVVGGGSLTIDAHTGDLSWCAPTIVGVYNVAILINSWREGYLIGSVERDMQINITPCDNHVPDIQTIKDTCIEAGTLLKFPVSVTDVNNVVATLTGVGGPLSPLIPPPEAQFNPVTAFVPLTGNFSWQTKCSHVRKQPYMVTFKANDNNCKVPLIDYETVGITVVASAPTNYSANPSGTSMVVKWDPSICSILDSNRVTGYEIYRHTGYTGWKHGPCETGVPAYTGYILIGTTDDVNDTSYMDNNNGQGLVQGNDYCYMIVAIYADGSESYATLEFCNKLIRDVPIITKVSVDSTSTGSGQITVNWIKPIADSANFDTIRNPGPYEFRVMQAQGYAGGLTFNKIASFTSPYFAALTADSYTATALNTTDNPYTYRIDLYADSLLKGSTNTASSVYLSITPGIVGKQLTLTWQAHVPWNNYLYYIYKKNASGNFILLDSTTSQSYTDSNLRNGATYCYKIESLGKYTDTTIAFPLINFSEEKCGLPIDITPPCAPSFTIIAGCSTGQDTLKWTNPNYFCTSNRDDAVLYRIYFSAIQGQAFDQLIAINVISDTSYVYKDSLSVAGCFAVTATDSSGNESAYSTVVCVDNCPDYKLPNVFSPNGDGKNDLFISFPYKYVKDANIKIYDRWGLLVFESNDPHINWNGINQSTNEPSMDGVYFYVCEVDEIRVTGIKTQTITGYIQLFRNK